MNTLSWLMYAAEVAGNLRGVLHFMVFIFGVGAGLIGIGRLAASGMANIDHDETAKALLPHIAKSFRTTLTVAVVCGVLAAAMPSQRTIYMIAASEAGEAVVTSPDAVEMMGDLKAIIKKRLKDELEAGE